MRDVISAFLLGSHPKKHNPKKTRTRCSPVDVDKLLSHGQCTRVQVKYRGLQRLR